jgi:hypothetical protein
MPADLTGVDLKIRRAKRQLANLKELIEATVNPNTYQFRLQYDANTAKHALTVRSVPVISPDWSVIVGEILYNLRSALDHLAWQLVILDGGTPGYKTQFPILKALSKGGLAAAQLRPSIRNSAILEALERVQRHRGPDGNPAPLYDSPLWQLHRLNIIDKHRLLLVVVCVLDVDNMWWGLDDNDPRPSAELVIEPVEEGATVASFDFHGAEPPKDFDAHPSLAVAIHEGEVPGISLIPIHDVLNTLVWSIERGVVERHFRALFA